jgi:hypothetical protein
MTVEQAYNHGFGNCHVPASFPYFVSQAHLYHWTMPRERARIGARGDRTISLV